ncbi:unnamed protein product [Lampetra planeri]
MTLRTHAPGSANDRPSIAFAWECTEGSFDRNVFWSALPIEHARGAPVRLPATARFVCEIGFPEALRERESEGDVHA